MTTYYFAARYSRNAEMREYRQELTAVIAGARVTSRWIDQHGGNLLESFVADQLNTDPAECAKYAQADLEDLILADVVVSFTGNGGGGKGGRHVEFGYALATQRIAGWISGAVTANSATQLMGRTVLVGPRENVFHCLPAVEQYDGWTQFLREETKRVSGR